MPNETCNWIIGKDVGGGCFELIIPCKPDGANRTYGDPSDPPQTVCLGCGKAVQTVVDWP